ncbi:hypothetical protein [Serratia liquefaciens]|uniref:hypothetical protein n=1 Tax=Serratia liquefaciens TaxID=614 RepID=UPI0023616566|nr:hypothetical protein [Serratia liquefaciens]
MSRQLFPAEIEFNEIMMDGNHISPTTFEAIHRFTLLFSLFEAKLLNCEGSQGKSGQYATDFIASGLVDVAHLDSSYGYFENRYSDANHGKGRYQTLCGNRGGELGNVVNKIINSASPSIEEKLTACLFIAFRLRNNLFHGPKWLYNIAYQVDNFDAASHIIQSILRISRHNGVWNVNS